MPALCLQPVRSHGALRVALIGRLDRQTADSFSHTMSTLLDSPGSSQTPAVLDLKCCTTIDAEGAAALNRVRALFGSQGRELQLEGIPPLIEHVLGGTAQTI